jgi:LmbE family N-acetylglucosaminyl deacetylase
VTEDAPTIDLRRSGPSEDEWMAVTARLPPFVLPPVRRLVVVSPHPDDETFGAGGLIATADELGLGVLVVSVTDGEAASALPDLALVRRRELLAALPHLCPAGRYDVVRLGVPDGRVGEHEAAVRRRVRRWIRATDLVVSTLGDDGHPDHESTARAAIDAAWSVGAAARTVPIWAWHCHQPLHSPIGAGHRLDLGPDARRRKHEAVRRFASQIDAPDPVVPPFMLERLLRPFEVLVDPVGAG